MAKSPPNVPYEPASRPRIIDTTNSDARAAVAEVIARCLPARGRLAVILARSERRLSREDRALLSEECDSVHGLIEVARKDLRAALSGASPKVTSHSRVADATKALDNLEKVALQARAALQE